MRHRAVRVKILKTMSPLNCHRMPIPLLKKRKKMRSSPLNPNSKSDNSKTSSQSKVLKLRKAKPIPNLFGPTPPESSKALRKTIIRPRVTNLFRMSRLRGFTIVILLPWAILRHNRNQTTPSKCRTLLNSTSKVTPLNQPPISIRSQMKMPRRTNRTPPLKRHLRLRSQLWKRRIRMVRTSRSQLS